MRRAVKLRYDEGLGDNSSEMNVAASSALCVMHKRMIDSPRRVPQDPLPEIGRCIQSLIATDLLLRPTTMEDPAIRGARSGSTKNILRMWNVIVQEEMTVTQARQLITEIMGREPDPFSKSPAWSP
jgi:hypothetical protein